jgi:hypothetical protein
MKKTIASFLLICLTVIFLTACGNTTPADNTAAPENVPTVASSAVEQQTPTEAILQEGEAIAASFAELQTALTNPEISVIYINSAIEITSELSFERNDDLEIRIKPEGTLTINAPFSPVACAMINDGTLIINNTFERGISTLTNNGTITVNKGGKVASGMSNTENHGTFNVEAEGELSIDRGSVFNNFSTLTNAGLVTITDGGQLNDEGGSITNNGTIDLNSFFNGDIAKITGTGTLNDNRE